MKNELFSLLLFLIFSAPSSATNNKKDSILEVIYEADQVVHLNSIQTEVGPKINALNNWANEAVWNEPDIVKEVVEELIPYAIMEKNDSLLSWSYHYLGLTYYDMHFWKLSISTYEKALETQWAKYSPTAASFRAFCTLNIGCNYEFLGDYDKAARYYYQSINMNEDLGIPYVAAEAKLDLASLNIRMKNNQEARENINEALIVLWEFNDSVRISEGYRMLSTIEIEQKNYAEAENCFNKALTIGKALNDKERLVKIYQDYGEAFFTQRHYQKALKLYNNALEYCHPSIFPASYFEVNGNIGKTQMQLGKLDLAEKNLLNAHQGLSVLKSNTLLLAVEQNLTDLYARKGDLPNFEKFFTLAVERKDTLAAIEKLRSIGESEVIYKTAQKERLLELQAIKLIGKRKQVILASTIALLLLLGFIIVLRLLKKVNTKNKNLLQRNLELSKQWEQIQITYKLNEKKKGKPTLFQSIYTIVAEEEGYSNPLLSVDLLASTLNSNVKYISKAIKENTNMNFNSFVNTFRIEKAKKVLRSEEGINLSLEAISEMCGFNNQTTFYQKFKQITGLTPSVYRKIAT